MNVKKLLFLLVFMTLIFIILFNIFIKPEYHYSLGVGLHNKGEATLEKIILGPAKEPLKNPIDLAVNASGEIYVTDSDNNRIQVFNNDGEFLFKFGRFGKKNGELNYPVGIVIDSSNTVYVAELNNQRISVFNKKGKFIRKIAVKNQSGEVGVPTALAIDHKDYLYMIDKTDNAIVKMTKRGKVLMKFGKLGNQNGQFQYPLGISVSKKGEIFVSDTGNSRVQIFDEQGNFKNTYSGSLGTPSGIVADEKDRIYTSDPLKGNIVVSSYWGEEEAVIGDIGVTADKLYIPEGIELKKDQLFIADKGNNRIVVYKLKQ